MSWVREKLGRHNKKTDQGEAEKERGKLDKDETESCYKKNTFPELKGREQEAFFRYLRGDNYPEKEDICSVEPGKLSGPSRKYQFWLKCEKIELLKLFQVYISTDDDEKRLPEVQDCVVGEDDMEKFLKDKEKDAQDLEDFIKELKQKTEHELQREHDKFKKDLKEQSTRANK